MMEPGEIVARVQSALEGSRASVEDLTGTRDHFRVTIVAPQFAGKSLINQHRMVYEILHDCMEAQGGGIHALSLSTRAAE